MPLLSDYFSLVVDHLRVLQFLSYPHCIVIYELSTHIDLIIPKRMNPMSLRTKEAASLIQKTVPSSSPPSNPTIFLRE